MIACSEDPSVDIPVPVAFLLRDEIVPSVCRALAAAPARQETAGKVQWVQPEAGAIKGR